jgi:hypothetical protein
MTKGSNFWVIGGKFGSMSFDALTELTEHRPASLRLGTGSTLVIPHYKAGSLPVEAWVDALAK